MHHLISIVICLTLAGCGLDETTHRSDKPLSPAVACKNTPVSSFPFPLSTTDVYYYYHAGGLQEFEFFVRFTVDPKDLEKAVSDLPSDHDKTTQQHHFYTTAPIAGSPRLPEDKDLLWWSPDSVTNGFYYTTTNSQPFEIWADITHHTIYLCETD
jgi:hypothetical protein